MVKHKFKLKLGSYICYCAPKHPDQMGKILILFLQTHFLRSFYVNNV